MKNALGLYAITRLNDNKARRVPMLSHNMIKDQTLSQGKKQHNFVDLSGPTSNYISWPGPHN